MSKKKKKRTGIQWIKDYTEPCREDILQKKVGESACQQPLSSIVQCNCNKTYLKTQEWEYYA